MSLGWPSLSLRPSRPPMSCSWSFWLPKSIIPLPLATLPISWHFYPLSSLWQITTAVCFMIISVKQKYICFKKKMYPTTMLYSRSTVDRDENPCFFLIFHSKKFWIWSEVIMRVYNICIVYKRLKIYMFYFFSYHSCINLTKGKWHFSKCLFLMPKKKKCQVLNKAFV